MKVYLKSNEEICLGTFLKMEEGLVYYIAGVNSAHTTGTIKSLLMEVVILVEEDGDNKKLLLG